MGPLACEAKTLRMTRAFLCSDPRLVALLPSPSFILRPSSFVLHPSHDLAISCRDPQDGHYGTEPVRSIPNDLTPTRTSPVLAPAVTAELQRVQSHIWLPIRSPLSVFPPQSTTPALRYCSPPCSETCRRHVPLHHICPQGKSAS